MTGTTLAPSVSVDADRMSALRAEIHERLIAAMDLKLARSLNPEELAFELRRGAEEICNEKSYLLSQRDRETLIEDLVNETVGLGPLEPLMHDPTISDILVNGPDTVFVERRGQLEATNIRFRDMDHLVGIVQRIAAQMGRRVDESCPMVDARLPDGSRVNAVLRPLALQGALVSIRRFSATPFTPGDLIKRKSATAEMVRFLAACVKARLNIMVSGGTGSGKTTLLNLLSSFIPDNERIISIEDAAELQLQQSHVGRLETRAANVEGEGEITARDLVRNALRMRPDRIIVGECRGAEAFDMLQAMTTGHDGSLTTIHANGTRDAIARLEMLVGMAAPELPMWFIHRQIARAIQIVVHVARIPGGDRKLLQISEVTEMQGDTIAMHDIFEFEQLGEDEFGSARGGAFQATGIRPNCLARIRAADGDLSPNLFERRTLEIDRTQTLI